MVNPFSWRWGRPLVLTFLGVLLGLRAPADAQPLDEEEGISQSLWEVGVVGGGFYLPDYPSADQKHAKWIAAPYVIYRGNIFRADRDGARARLIRTRKVDLEMSFAASLATNSEDNDARRGMPDLDYLLESGPRLSMLLSDLGGRGRMHVNVPVRAVFSSDLHNFHHQGFTYGVQLMANMEPVWRKGWIGVVKLDHRFADRSLNAYFYDVSPAYVTITRPEYRSKGGYMGSDLSAGLAIPLGLRWRLFAGAQLFYNRGAANESSPLYRRDLDVALGAGLSYALFRSTARAKP